MPSNEPRAMVTGISDEIRTRGSAPVQGIVLEKFKAHTSLTSSDSTLISHNQPPHPTNTTCHPFSITATKTNHAKSFIFDDHQRSRHTDMRGSIQPHITTQPGGPSPSSPPPLRGRLLGGILAVSYALRFTASLRSRSRTWRSSCSARWASRSSCAACRALRALRFWTRLTSTLS